MSAIQHFALTGQLIADPEQRTSAEGKIFTKFTIADGDERKGQKVTWFRCVAFGKNAEWVSQWFVKGKPICVQGRVELDEYELKDGSKRADIKFIVNHADFVPETWGSKVDTEREADEQPRQTAKGQANAAAAPAKGADAPW
jgi:single stranded DNA-binding protein